jgi:hypothetical protein
MGMGFRGKSFGLVNIYRDDDYLETAGGSHNLEVFVPPSQMAKEVLCLLGVFVVWWGRERPLSLLIL